MGSNIEAIKKQKKIFLEQVVAIVIVKVPFKRFHRSNDLTKFREKKEKVKSDFIF